MAYRNEDWLAPQVAAAPSPNNGVLGDSSDGTLMVDEENLKLIKLLDTWSQEDATDDPDELDRRDQENAEFMANLQANRVNFPVPKL